MNDKTDLPSQRTQGRSPGEGRPWPLSAKIGIGGTLALGFLAALTNQGDKSGAPQPSQTTAVQMAPERVAPAAPPAPEPAGSEVIAVTAPALWKQFSENEVAAKAAYEGKLAKVSGRIEGITLDITDSPVVALASGQMFQEVQVSFEKSDAPAISALRKGQQLTVICGKVNEVIGSPMLSSCALVK